MLYDTGICLLLVLMIPDRGRAILGPRPWRMDHTRGRVSPPPQKLQLLYDLLKIFP